MTNSQGNDMHRPEQEILEPNNPSTALTVNEIKNPALVFVANGLDPILENIKASARKKAAELDISTPANRAAIISLSVEVRDEKTSLEKIRVALVADQKRALKLVDVEASRAWDELDALQKEIRKPVSDWEDAETARVQAHNDYLAEIATLQIIEPDALPADINSRIQTIADIYAARDWQEFSVPAQKAIQAANFALADVKHRREKEIKDAAELTRLRAEEDERNRKLDEQYQDALVDHAAYTARVAAEKKAADDAMVARELAEKATKDAADAAQKLLDDAAQALVDAAKKSADDKIAADKALADAETKRLADLATAQKKAEDDKATALKKQQDDALAAQKVIDGAIAAQALVDKQRAENVVHQKKINNEVLLALQSVVISTDKDGGESFLKDEPLKALITAIAQGKVPHVKITY